MQQTSSAAVTRKKANPIGLAFSIYYWSPRTELNRQPADYKSAALPLSHVGFSYNNVFRDACAVPVSIDNTNFYHILIK
jgi:hypothetical protein